jgi:hypothetical protein
LGGEKRKVGRKSGTKRKQSRKKYRLQRWDIIDGSEFEAKRAFKGWMSQLPGADLRLLHGNKVVAKHYHGLYKKRRGQTIKKRR